MKIANSKNAIMVYFTFQLKGSPKYKNHFVEARMYFFVK